MPVGQAGGFSTALREDTTGAENKDGAQSRVLRYPSNSHGVQTVRIFQNKCRKVRAGQSTGKWGKERRQERVVLESSDEVRQGTDIVGWRQRYWVS